MADSDPPISATMVGNLVGSSGETLGERLGALLDAEDVIAWQASDIAGLRVSTAQATLLQTLLRRIASALEGGASWDTVELALALFEAAQASTEPGGAAAHMKTAPGVEDDDDDPAGMSSTDIPPPPADALAAPPLSATMPGDVLEVLAAAEARVAAQRAESERTNVSAQPPTGVLAETQEHTEVSARLPTGSLADTQEHTEVSTRLPTAEARKPARERALSEETLISEVALPTLDPLVGEVTMLSSALSAGAAPSPNGATNATPPASPLPPQSEPVASGAAQEGRTRHISYRSDAHGFALTVEEYAAFCAERDADPARLKPLRARYDIPHDRGHAAIDRFFEQLFARDPSMRQLWQHHYQSFALLLRG